MLQPNPAVIIKNFGYIAQILEGISIVMGIGLLVGAFHQFKRWGEMRTFMSYQMTLAAPLAMMIAGVMFLTLPSTITSALLFFWDSTNPLATQATNHTWSEYVPVVVVFVRIIGVGAVMRAIMFFARSGGHQSQPGSIGRGLTHLLGGVLLIHIVGTVHLLKSIFGIVS